MVDVTEHIQAFDCLAFDKEQITAEVIQAFMSSQQKNVFWFSPNFKSDDETILAEYDYGGNCWKAGRFIGEALFSHQGKTYRITIKPRFGEKILLRMLEEIFNVRITSSASQTSNALEWQHYIRRIISLIWLQKLATANLHGLPKVQIKKEHKGQAIKGRLEIRKTVIALHRSDEAVSSYREKHVDATIAQILYQAYKILKLDFNVGSVSIPEAARDAIDQIFMEIKSRRTVSENDYQNIRYKDIYLSWKPIVDLSWDIIKRKQISLKQEKAKSGYGFFIDMAEVWEQYLRSIMKRKLLPNGWHYKNEKLTAYKGFFFQRNLIPDLVFQRGNEIAIWDAKYKRMTGRFYDVDRADFFQIHTYIQYHLGNKQVKAAGLLYPISTSPNYADYTSNYLINEQGIKMNFSIDGVELIENQENDNFRMAESDFIERLEKSLL